jgi:hypothetical protein
VTFSYPRSFEELIRLITSIECIITWDEEALGFMDYSAIEHLTKLIRKARGEDVATL